MNFIGIMDLEFTAWEGSRARGWSGQGEEREIVQIGALKISGDDMLKECEALDILVRPRINPQLSDYFRNLTGITQRQLDREGLSFEDALMRLGTFLGGIDGPVYSMGTDCLVIEENCSLYDVAYPFDNTRFADLRPILANTVGRSVAAADSSQLPQHMSFDNPGTAHQGIFDCRCIAETLRILRRRGLF
ncbi:MAG: exonuclease domain-containing protein [Rhodospirillales bacterium]|nr:exonuclease domain-containing protein [Rhodospirillales bacterium]MBO6786883.1 exonuclease domain-containing protein [Rhodospirillales bacterium]